jgi:hypothetical protein
LRLSRLEKRLRRVGEGLDDERRRVEYDISVWAAEHRDQHAESEDAFKEVAMYIASMQHEESGHVGELVPPSWLEYVTAQAAYVRQRVAEELSGQPRRVVVIYESELERQYGQIERHWRAIANHADELEDRYAERYEEAASRLLSEMGMKSWECLPSRWEPFAIREKTQQDTE